MTGALFAASGFMAYQPQNHAPPCFLRLITGYMIIWLVFLHMRLFDEVKDYEDDRKYNPDRPLARKLIGLEEFGLITLCCIILQFIIASVMRWPIFASYMMLLCFTLLMRMEFFVGKWMKSKLELYAITHTFSAFMISMMIHTIVCFSDFAAADNGFIIFALGNWLVFNVFEFGRKTFAKEEEQEGVDSYSKRLNPSGAVLLLATNLILAFVCYYQAATLKFEDVQAAMFVAPAVFGLLPILAGIYYCINSKKASAKLYRGVVSLYLLGYPTSIAASIYWFVYK